MHLVEERDDATVIHVHQPLDPVSSPALASLIAIAERNKTQRVIVSLKHCNYCYASGLSVLAVAHRRIGSKFLVVVPDEPKFRRIFEITGLSTVLHLTPTLQSALDAKLSVSL